MKFTNKADIFSAGCLFFNLLTGRQLYYGADPKEMLNCNKYADPIRVVHSFAKYLDKECVSLLCAMLIPNPDLRPSAEQCLSHPWFQTQREAL